MKELHENITRALYCYYLTRALEKHEILMHERGESSELVVQQSGLLRDAMGYLSNLIQGNKQVVDCFESCHSMSRFEFYDRVADVEGSDALTPTSYTRLPNYFPGDSCLGVRFSNVEDPFQ